MLTGGQYIYLPLTFPSQCFGVWCEHENPATDGTTDMTKEWEIHEYQTNRFWVTANVHPCTLFWLTIGK